MQTIMMNVMVDKDYVFLRTVSRNYRPPQRFILSKKELSDLENDGQIIVKDICSFVVLKLYSNYSEPPLFKDEIRMT